MSNTTDPGGNSKTGLDVFKVADLLVSRSIATHGDDIDLIAYYGSHAQGVARAGSDLDIFYVPADGKDPPVGRTVLVEGLLFDFWAIRWETLEGFATGRIRGWSFAPAIIHHARTLYARGEAQRARLDALKQKVLDLQAPEARPGMIQRALDAFSPVLAHLGNLRLAVAGGEIAGDFADVRHAGWKVILAAWECLALANQAFCDQGWGKLLEQIPRLRTRPDNLEALITTISTSRDPALIAGAAEDLALGTRRALRDLQQTLAADRTAPDVFGGAYPEIHDGIGKVLAACAGQRPVAASATAWFAQFDLSLMLNSLRSGANGWDFNLYSEIAPVYRELGFPDLMRASAGELPTLAAQAGLLDARLRTWLRAQNIDLGEFETLGAFERSLAGG